MPDEAAAARMPGLQALHATFHEIAGSIAERLNRLESGTEMQAWLAEFDNLSAQLILLLQEANRKA